MRRAVPIAGATVIAAGVVESVRRRWGAQSRIFAVVVVWAPMTWLGTISRLITPRLPSRWYQLRGFERDGARIYELAGVRVAKAALRRGPLAVFNPDLHLPAEPSPERLAQLDQRMRDAEATHAILFAATLGVVVNALTQRWWTAAHWTMAANVAMNGYPVMLQRYNRARLHQRFTAELDGGAGSRDLRVHGGTSCEA